jgi:hypothetical protein
MPGKETEQRGHATKPCCRPILRAGARGADAKAAESPPKPGTIRHHQPRRQADSPDGKEMFIYNIYPSVSTATQATRDSLFSSPPGGGAAMRAAAARGRGPWMATSYHSPHAYQSRASITLLITSPLIARSVRPTAPTYVREPRHRAGQHGCQDVRHSRSAAIY